MINCKNISFSYSKNNKVLDDICLELNDGHIYGLLGKNGEGKTTLLKILSGSLIPQAGDCLLWGKSIKYRPVDLLQKLFFVPETPLFPDISIDDFFKVYTPFYPSFDNVALKECIEKFEIDCKKKILKSSQGQQKKVIISMALAAKTPLLLFDEPTNGLDIPSKRIFRQLIASLVDEKQIVIISTHQVRDLESLIDSVIILNEKKVVFSNPLEDCDMSLEVLFEKVING
jgi:ABC-type multidrug transport system, ATPase component